MGEISAKVKNYDKRIREQNKRKLILQKKRENGNYASVHRSSTQSVRVLRATPVTPNNEIHPRKTKRTRSVAKSRDKIMQSKENYNHLNHRQNKKYEYGNPSVLAWMQKQKRQRLEKQKSIEQKKKDQIEKRKAYIANLNHMQKQRAKKIIKKKKM